MSHIVTDGDLATQVQALADGANVAAKVLRVRAADSARCSCNVGGPGLCAHHAWAYEQLRDAGEKLRVVTNYLLRLQADW